MQPSAGNPARSTIVAPATAPGRAAIAVVRLSGPEAWSLLERLAPPPPAYRPRYATLRLLRDPTTGDTIDEALVLPFRGPASYTGEDLVEFHLHGNPVVVARLVEVLVAQGARPAEPGAFTRRAILAGKLGLPEAEALAELIEAVSPRGAAAALARLRGRTRRWAESVREQALTLLARIEAVVDFPDEGDVELAEDLDTGLARLATTLRTAAERARAAHVWSEGAEVMLVGAPNVGKSTLLNRLVGEERAIVSPWAGTTRDLVEAAATLGGIPIRLLDTAGLRRGGDPIEREGIRRVAARLASADLVVRVRTTVGEDPEAEAEVAAQLAGVPEERLLVVWNKVDLAPAPPGALAVSAATGAGVPELAERIGARLAARADATSELTGARQAELAATAATHVDQARAFLAEGAPAELAAEELRIALAELDRLIGRLDPEEVLDLLFTRFCIGK